LRGAKVAEEGAGDSSFFRATTLAAVVSVGTLARSSGAGDLVGLRAGRCRRVFR